MRRTTTIVGAALLVASLAGCGDDAPKQAASPPPSPPALTTSEINQQDRVSRAHKRRESHAMDSRPLLDRLPLTIGGVRISVGGLAADNRTTVLLIDAGTRTDAEALAIYRDALHAYRDDGRAYEPRVQP